MSANARTILLLATVLAPPLARALGLGNLTGSGALGAPLEAYVPLYLAPAEHATLKSVEVLPDAFARDDATPLADLLARIERDGTRSYVRIITTTPLRVERLRFRLRVNTTQAAVVGRYALRVAASSAKSSLASAARGSARGNGARIVARSPASVAVPPQAGTGRYGPVRHGESLWTIARRIAPDRDPHSTMRALHALNPEAFVGNDMNRLRAGVTLSLPADLSQARAQKDGAIATRSTEVASDAADTRTTTGDERADATPASPPATTDALDALRSEEAANSDSARDETINERAATSSDPEGTTAVRAAPPEAALAQRLAELDAKFAAIRAKYGESSSPAATDTAPSASSPDVELAPAPQAAPRLESALVAKPQASRAQAVKSAPTTTPPTDRNLPGWLLGGLFAGLLLAGLLIAWPRVNRRLIARRTQSTAADSRAADADRRAEVARKAENRVRLESEIQGLLKRKQTAMPPAPPPAASAPLADTTAPPLSPFEQTLDALAVTQAGGVLERDREIAIDAHIAHGRYAEAETLLREAIKAHPRNVQAKLRLAEVYYITEKLDGFAAIAGDLKAQHRGDLSDEEWQRLVRMGKIIAPDLALFSGPKAVGRRA